MAEKKLTQRDYFMMLRDMVEAYNPENADTLLTFIDDRIVALDLRKAHKKPNPKQKENEELLEVVLGILRGATEPMTYAEILSADERLVGRTTQWLTPLIKKIGEDTIVRTKKDKKLAIQLVEGV